MLEKINKITNWQASLVLALTGFFVYFDGLKNQFIGDDNGQIVNNPVVHSMSNIQLFFQGGTFYIGHGIAPMYGNSFRPLMTTVFSFIYTLFGSHPIYYHLFQLALWIGSSILLYLLFRYYFSSAVSIFLSLVFLVHPMNSQIVFAIATMQDALFIFFGLLALWLLLRFDSLKSLIFVAICLFLSLLSKESGVFFIAIALLYLTMFKRNKRLFEFMVIMVLPIVAYSVLRINAIGLLGHIKTAPIDSLNLAGRLFTLPSILLFDIVKFVFPLKLASAYYWTYSSFSFAHFLIPLFVDVTVIGLIVYVGKKVRKLASRNIYDVYRYFAIWSAIGLVLTTQIVPLDMTVCETWFSFSMIGVLGMVGVSMSVFKPCIRPVWILLIAVFILGFLGLRTAIRGFDWSSPYTLAQKDITVSREDYNAYESIATELINQNKYSEAKFYVDKSIKIYPTYNNCYSLGVILTYQNDYSGAMKAYEFGLMLGNDISINQNLAALTLVTGDPQTNKQLMLRALQTFPHDSNIWMYLAILDDRNNDNYGAKIAITNAQAYGQVPAFIYDNIINNEPFTINLADKGVSIQVP